MLRLEQTERDYDNDVITGQDLKRKRDRITEEMEEIDARIASDLQQSETAKVLNAPDPGAPSSTLRSTFSAPCSGRC